MHYAEHIFLCFVSFFMMTIKCLHVEDKHQLKQEEETEIASENAKRRFVPEKVFLTAFLVL